MTPGNNRGLFFLALVIRSVSKPSFTGFIEFFFSLAFFFPFGVGLFVLYSGWPLIPYCIFTMLCFLGINLITWNFYSSFRILGELDNFLEENQHRRMTSIRTEQYFAKLRMSAANIKAYDEDEFRLQMTAMPSRFVTDFARLIVIETDNSASTGVLTTFNSFDGSWVFLSTHPDQMKRSQHFTVLHELGHTEMEGNMSYLFPLTIKQFLLSILPFAVMIRWELLPVATLLITIGFAYWTLTVARNVSRSYGRFWDEICADEFALMRSPAEWFRNFSDSDIEVVATSWSRSLPTDNSTKTAVHSELTDDQSSLRKSNLAASIKSIRDGEELPKLDPLVIHRLKRFFLIRAFQMLTLLGLCILLGLQFGELSALRLTALGLIAVIAYMLGTAVRDYGDGMRHYVDSRIGFVEGGTLGKKAERRLNDYRMLRTVIDGFKALQLREITKGQYLAAIADHRIDTHFEVSGITGTMFTPDEVEVYAGPDEGSWIYHRNPIDYSAISHLEFYKRNLSMVVAMADGTKRSLGTGVPWHVRPFFMENAQVTINRIENSQSAESDVVPLKVIG